jgi:hypothetical protein
MAKYNEILVGRFNRGLQKHFSMKGEPPAPQLSSDIVPSVAFFWGRENRYLESWYTFGQRMTAPAPGAGNTAAVRLRNPAGSNIVAVIERVVATNTAGVADQPILRHGIGSGGTIPDLNSVINLGSAALDARGQTAPNCIGSQTAATNQVAPPSSVVIAQLAFGANGFCEYIPTDIDEIPLLPGDCYDVVSNAINQQLVTSWLWRERFLEDSERT